MSHDSHDRGWVHNTITAYHSIMDATISLWLWFANHHRNLWYLYLLVPYLQVELPCMESLMVMGQRVTDVLLLQEVPHVIWLIWPTHDVPWHPMTQWPPGARLFAGTHLWGSRSPHLSTRGFWCFMLSSWSIIVGSLQVLKAAFAETQAEMLRHGSSEC